MEMKVIKESQMAFIKETMAKLKIDQNILHVESVKKYRQNKMQDRVIILTKHRVLTFKVHGMGSKKLCRNGHLYELKKIAIDTEKDVFLSFNDFAINFRSNNADEFLEKLLGIIRSVDAIFPDEIRTVNEVPAFRIAKYSKPVVPQFKEGFLNAYIANCDFFNCSPDETFMAFLSDQISYEKTILDLRRQTHSSENMKAIFATLRQDKSQYFNHLVSNNGALSDAIISEVATCIKHFFSIEIHGGSAKDGLSVLAEAIAANTDCMLEEINLSGVKLNGNCFLPLVQALGALNELKKMNFSSCKLNERVMVDMFGLFEASNSIANHMISLELNNNNMGNRGTAAMVRFIQAKTPSRLSHLGMGNSGVMIRDLLCAIHAAGLGIESLDLSCTQLSADDTGALCTFISDDRCKLQKLNLRKVQISAPLLLCIVSVFTESCQTTLDIDLRGIGDSKSWASDLACLLSETRGLTHLRLGGAFSAEDLSMLLTALCDNVWMPLKELALESCIDTTIMGTETVDGLLLLLARLISNRPLLTAVAVTGNTMNKITLDNTDNHLFNAISKNPAIQDLDVSGHSWGDDITRGIILAVNNSTHIHSIKIADNLASKGCVDRIKENMKNPLTFLKYVDIISEETPAELIPEAGLLSEVRGLLCNNRR
eukprot:TRINITY_DN272_c0_g1_i1.p1 TRINITY_DN272_c0_g1~~TRINITY_DN272_c0_g1_i1.p1  ORF type:complete len:655 (-),score=147.90 TRINITY_DN272_c0_g1_i1:468-2432(-)